MKPKTIESYKKEILAKYIRESGGELHTYLLNPTPKKIKNACIAKYNKRYSKSDYNILNSFFGFKKDINEVKSIQNLDTDKLKPIVNFLKGNTKSTDDINLELISWLIDFTPRPYINYRKQPINREVVETKIKNNGLAFANSNSNASYENKNSELPKDKTQAKPFIKNRLNIIIGILLVLLIIAFGIGKDVYHIGKDVNLMKKISVKQLHNYLEEGKPVYKATFASGEVDYFNAPGKHPVTGQKLVFVTKKELKNIVEKEHLQNKKNSKESVVKNTNYQNIKKTLIMRIKS